MAKIFGTKSSEGLRFDGLNVPRPVQVEAMTWLRQSWDRAEILGLNLHTGSGKSAIARALQLQHNATVVTMSNALLEQYSTTYPNVEVLKGAETWKCSKTKLSCGETNEVLKEYCGGCPYQRGRASFLEGHPVFTNPAAYYYTSMAKDWGKPDVVIIDEAHNLLEFLTGMSDDFWPIGWEGCPETTDPHKLLSWAADKERLYATKAKTSLDKKQAGLALRFQRIAFTLRECLDDVSIEIATEKFRRVVTRGVRVIQVRPTESVIRKFMGKKKTVLMSATLMPGDVKAFSLGRRSLFQEFSNPIPKENRPIYIDHIPGHKGAATNPESIVNWIIRQREKYPGNCIVHTTYAMSQKLAPFFKDAIVNTQEDKIKCIKEFKKNGGLFIASGCAEGLDLPGDECRLNLIPVLYRDNLGSDLVKKRLAEPNGRKNYDLKTIRTTTQQAGRSTRSPVDSSVVVVGDMGFRLLLSRYRSELSPDFVESIK